MVDKSFSALYILVRYFKANTIFLVSVTVGLPFIRPFHLSIKKGNSILQIKSMCEIRCLWLMRNNIKHYFYCSLESLYNNLDFWFLFFSLLHPFTYLLIVSMLLPLFRETNTKEPRPLNGTSKDLIL